MTKQKTLVSLVSKRSKKLLNKINTEEKNPFEDFIKEMKIRFPEPKMTSLKDELEQMSNRKQLDFGYHLTEEEINEEILEELKI